MLFLIWIMCATVCAVVAGSRERNAIGWFFLGLLFGIFAIILVALLPSRKYAVRPRNPHSIATRVLKSGAPAPPAVETIEQLANLHQLGVVTDEEFATKKQELPGTHDMASSPEGDRSDGAITEARHGPAPADHARPRSNRHLALATRLAAQGEKSRDSEGGAEKR